MTYVKKTDRILVYISFLLMLTVSAFSHELPMVVPEAVGLSTERLSRVDKVMEKYVAQQKIAGGVTLLARHGKIAHLGTYGMMDVEAEKPMMPDTIFRIASMTKPITSVAVMMLYEEGHFRLHEPVSLCVNCIRAVVISQREFASSTTKRSPTEIEHYPLTNKRTTARSSDFEPQIIPFLLISLSFVE